MEHNNPAGHTGDQHDPAGGVTLSPWSSGGGDRPRWSQSTSQCKNNEEIHRTCLLDLKDPHILISNTEAAEIYIPSVCFGRGAHTLRSWSYILLDGLSPAAEAKTPRLYATESAAGSPASRRVIKSSVERVSALLCALINAYFISVPTDRRGCVAGEERETDRHLVFFK